MGLQAEMPASGADWLKKDKKFKSTIAQHVADQLINIISGKARAKGMHVYDA